MPIRIERHDSPLGRWLLARWTPARLAGAVETRGSRNSTSQASRPRP